MKRADIKTWFNCNNRCKFCVQGKKRSLYPGKTKSEIENILKEARRDCNSVVFTGGEPAVRKDIIDLVRFAKKLGFETIQIQTNGRMFCYKEFCEAIILAGANEFSPAIHGHNAKLHDYLTGSKGSFEQSIEGIKNLKQRSQTVMTNTVITKFNYRFLPQIAKLLVSLNVDQYQFAFVHALGSAGENFSSIVPRMSKVIPYVKRGLDVGIAVGKMVMTEAIPYCFMQGYEEYVAERIIPRTRIYDYKSITNDFTEARKKEGKLKGPKCIECKHFQCCEGPWREYPEKFGWNEFIPLK